LWYKSQLEDMTPGMQPLLETVDLRKTYRVGKIDVEALRGVSIRVGSGEMVAVMGPSGCGKSSLMHILGAMMRPTSGRVLIEGQNTADMDERARTEFRRRKIGFVFQKFNLLPTLTAAGNIRVARRIDGSLHDPEVDTRLEELLALLRIDDKMERRPAELSGGEQQRVAVARAVIKNPAILLADEPTGNLDSGNSQLVLDMFRKLNQTLGQTIILVTHNPELARFADRVIQMRDGRVVGDEADEEVWAPDLVSEASGGTGAV
jgi:putative ABC transport system ATP-binding protein